MSSDNDTRRARAGRRAALVVAGGGLLAIASQIGRGLGLSPRIEVLLLLIAAAMFIWALAVAWQVWQKRD